MQLLKVAVIIHFGTSTNVGSYKMPECIKIMLNRMLLVLTLVMLILAMLILIIMYKIFVVHCLV